MADTDVKQGVDSSNLNLNNNNKASGGKKPGDGPSKPRGRRRGPKKGRGKNGSSEDDPPETKVTTDYCKNLMDQTMPTPPVDAELRLIDIFQSLLTGTLYNLVVCFFHIAGSPTMLFESPMYVRSSVSMDGYLWTFFICLAIAVKFSFVVDSMISQRLGHRTNKMTGAIHRQIGKFYTIDRGISLMKFFGTFTTAHYETVFPSYLLDAHGFLFLAWVYSVYHLERCFQKPNAWCRTSTWRSIFHNAETSKCQVANMDAVGFELDTWFTCFEYDRAQKDGLILRPTRMFVDEEDFRVTFAGLVACLIVNTWNVEVHVKGEVINPGADNILVDPTSRSILDLFTYMPTRRNTSRAFMITDRDGNVVTTNGICRNMSPIDPYFEVNQAAGNGPYTLNLTMGHVFAVLRDVNIEELTRAGTVYFDSNAAGPRAGGGFNVGRCEALQLILAYGGMTMMDENYLEKLGSMGNYFHGDGTYFQNDGAANSMVEEGLYVAFYEKHLTLIIPTVSSFCRYLPTIYAQELLRYGIKLFRIPTPTTSGSTTQLFSSIPCYRGGRDKAFMDRIETPSDYRPSLVGSSSSLTAVKKNDAGLLLAPTVLVERVCESSILSGGSFQAAFLAFVENPACALREFPVYNPGFQ